MLSHYLTEYTCVTASSMLIIQGVRKKGLDFKGYGLIQREKQSLFTNFGWISE